jgi:hypothetical protein
MYEILNILGIIFNRSIHSITALALSGISKLYINMKLRISIVTKDKHTDAKPIVWVSSNRVFTNL